MSIPTNATPNNHPTAAMTKATDGRSAIVTFSATLRADCFSRLRVLRVLSLERVDFMGSYPIGRPLL